jgi:2,4-dienoyl-CoA reductase-like NADH-dependent reductase (Old Yellow Enzyme family)
MLVDAGAAMISVSAGGRIKHGGEYSYLRAFPMHDWPDAMNAYLSEEIKREVSVPIAIAGKIGSAEIAEKILERGQADLVALGRALLTDPEWANKVRERRSHEIDRCIYCHYCRDHTEKGDTIRCVKTPSEPVD